MRNRWLTLTGILSGMGLSAIMRTYLSISMPAISEKLQGVSLYNWVFGAYLLASTLSIPISAKLADRYGRLRLYVIGMILFAGGIAVSALSFNIVFFIMGRVLMGVGAGAITPSALGIIGEFFDKKDYSKIFGLMGGIQVLAHISGPLIGGLLSTYFDWRWGFWMFVPPAGICCLMVFAGISQPRFRETEAGPRTKKREGIDWIGALLLSSALVGVILGFQMIGWKSYLPGFLLFGGGCILLYLVYRHQKSCKNPLLPIELIGQASIRRGVISVFILGGVNNSAVIYLSLFYKKVLGISSMVTGLYLLPMLIAAGAASMICGKVKGSLRKFAELFLWLCSAVAFMGIGWVGGYWNGIPGVLCSIPIGVAIGFLLPIYLGDSQMNADSNNRATSGGIVQLARNLGGTLGVTLLGIPITLNHSLAGSMTFLFTALALLCLLTFILLIPKDKQLEFLAREDKS